MLTLKRFSQFAVLIITLYGCSTAEVAPDVSVMPEVPDYVKVPHPVGYEIAEIRALFENPLAPKNGLGVFADSCDAEFRQLLAATSVKSEHRQGAAELVTLDAEKMHWCFYSKVERMQNELRNEQSWSARQKIVLDAYEFLAPVANAFLSVYHDSRYLRWATQYYSNISEWIFFRKVVPGPENTLALTTSATSDLEAWTTQDAKNKQKPSIFARYGINVGGETDESGPTLGVTQDRQPARAAPVTFEESGPVPTLDTSVESAAGKQVPDAPLAPLPTRKKSE